MKTLAKAFTIAAVLGASAAAFTTAEAWGGPWGGNMFGMDMAQSGYGHPGGYRPWGGNMFGMDMGQSYGYGGYAPYYGGYTPYGYGYPAAPRVVVPQQVVPAK